MFGIIHTATFTETMSQWSWVIYTRFLSYRQAHRHKGSTCKEQTKIVFILEGINFTTLYINRKSIASTITGKLSEGKKLQPTVVVLMHALYFIVRWMTNQFFAFTTQAFANISITKINKIAVFACIWLKWLQNSSKSYNTLNRLLARGSSAPYPTGWIHKQKTWWNVYRSQLCFLCECVHGASTFVSACIEKYTPHNNKNSK